MHTLYTNLLFNLFPLKNTINIKDYGTLPYIIVPNEDLNPNFISILTSVNLQVKIIERFYVNPNSPSSIQTNYPNQDVAKLFYMYTNNPTIINWYEINTNSPNTISTEGYYQYNPSEVTFELSTVVGFPTLIQSGLPSNFKNPKERIYCLSITLADMNSNTITIDNAIEKLSIYVKNPKL